MDKCKITGQICTGWNEVYGCGRVYCKFKKKPEPETVMPERYVVVGGIYRHFKGGLYLVENVVTHTETGEKLVVYINIENASQGWARPYDEFMSKVDREKYPDAGQTYRFELEGD